MQAMTEDGVGTGDGLGRGAMSPWRGEQDTYTCGGISLESDALVVVVVEERKMAEERKKVK